MKGSLYDFRFNHFLALAIFYDKKRHIKKGNCAVFSIFGKVIRGLWEKELATQGEAEIIQALRCLLHILALVNSMKSNYRNKSLKKLIFIQKGTNHEDSRIVYSIYVG